MLVWAVNFDDEGDDTDEDEDIDVDPIHRRRQEQRSRRNQDHNHGHDRERDINGGVQSLQSPSTPPATADAAAGPRNPPRRVVNSRSEEPATLPLAGEPRAWDIPQDNQAAARPNDGAVKVGSRARIPPGISDETGSEIASAATGFCGGQRERGLGSVADNGGAKVRKIEMGEESGAGGLGGWQPANCTFQACVGIVYRSREGRNYGVSEKTGVGLTSPRSYITRLLMPFVHVTRNKP